MHAIRQVTCLSVVLAVTAAGQAQDPWFDTFNCYQTGSGLIGQGGWDGWYHDPNANGLVTDEQYLSYPNSVKVADASDLCQYLAGYETGQWTIRAWHYVPAPLSASTYFIVNNEYDPDSRTAQWAIELNFRPDGTVIDDFRAHTPRPIAFNGWAEIRIEVDLDANVQATYYNGELVSEGTWAVRGGAVAIANFDLFSNGPIAFFDDLSLARAGVVCEQIKSLKQKVNEKKQQIKLKLKSTMDPQKLLHWVAQQGCRVVDLVTNARGKAKATVKGLVGHVDSVVAECPVPGRGCSQTCPDKTSCSVSGCTAEEKPICRCLNNEQGPAQCRCE